MTGGNHNIGGITGYVDEGRLLTAADTFWDIDTSDVLEALGNTTAPLPTLTNVLGLPSPQMKMASTYINSGWNFDTVWGIDPDINDGYPYLGDGVYYWQLNPPTNLTYQIENEYDVVLSWEEPEPGSTSILLGYSVYRTNEILTDPYTTELTFTDFDVEPGQYNYSVMAVYADGNSVAENIGVRVGDILNPVQNLAYSVSNNDLTLTWDPPEYGSNSPRIGYMVYRDHIPLTEYPITGRTFYDDNLPIGVYEYSVVVVYEHGDSVPVNITAYLLLLNPPQNLTYFVNENDVTLNWEAPEEGSGSEFIGYMVSRNSTPLIEEPINLLTFTDTQVPNGPHSYRVVAVYEYGNSSAIQVNVIVGLVMNPPQNLTYIVEQNNVTLSWEPPEDGSDYELVGYRVSRDNMFLEFTSIDELSFTDLEVPNGEYVYSVIAVYQFFMSSTVSVEVIVNVVSDKDITAYNTILAGNYPNPFNPETTIKFDLASGSSVLLEIYNIKGQKINTLVNSDFRAGSHKVVWNGIDDNGSSVSIGFYFPINALSRIGYEYVIVGVIPCVNPSHNARLPNVDIL